MGKFFEETLRTGKVNLKVIPGCHDLIDVMEIEKDTFESNFDRHTGILYVKKNRVKFLDILTDYYVKKKLKSIYVILWIIEQRFYNKMDMDQILTVLEDQYRNTDLLRDPGCISLNLSKLLRNKQYNGRLYNMMGFSDSIVGATALAENGTNIFKQTFDYFETSGVSVDTLDDDAINTCIDLINSGSLRIADSEYLLTKIKDTKYVKTHKMEIITKIKLAQSKPRRVKLITILEPPLDGKDRTRKISIDIKYTGDSNPVFDKFKKDLREYIKKCEVKTGIGKCRVTITCENK